jgi:hypothetical protein
MHKFHHFIRRELKEALIPTIFFLLLFHLAVFTRSLLLESYGITVVKASVATIGALIVAKAILIADKLPWTARFSGKPLLIGVLWKTATYTLLCLAFRFVEELVPLVTKYGGVMTAARHFLEEVSWPHFWALQIWLLIALAMYAAVVELDAHLGSGSVRKAFLG